MIYRYTSFSKYCRICGMICGGDDGSRKFDFINETLKISTLYGLSHIKIVKRTPNLQFAYYSEWHKNGKEPVLKTELKGGKLVTIDGTKVTFEVPVKGKGKGKGKGKSKAKKRKISYTPGTPDVKVALFVKKLLSNKVDYKWVEKNVFITVDGTTNSDMKQDLRLAKDYNVYIKNSKRKGGNGMIVHDRCRKIVLKMFRDKYKISIKKAYTAMNYLFDNSRMFTKMKYYSGRKTKKYK